MHEQIHRVLTECRKTTGHRLEFRETHEGSYLLFRVFTDDGGKVVGTDDLLGSAGPVETVVPYVRGYIEGWRQTKADSR